MLLQDFYKINSLQTENEQTIALVTINKDHEVFKGHFPGNPVTPGVCIMQIVKDITSQVVGKLLFMASSSNVKFMEIINPEVTPDLEFTLNITELDGVYRVKNVTKFNDTVALKLSMNLKVV
ncbi:3-hydroxyacyl-ACP dehydratase [Tamlana nanhaiensis]|uniref:3-hydroxyacyl-ACP dehydratase n=1 Tax=Neotamlana nanhaiensis TaxID=1382798 RepID=A0A0D7VZ01_9FLAO|nr:3-hydroxyacyl-ACP dehydratase [Tamlana nanhaiensis]KJD32115.1 3-hydroxyacyl-ACP dehydratase [Tamlana nanhaiensis]KJD32277.1 3-hydroxyacyl-ACP dehydratase [Tamlana nanhaiensis]